MNTKDKGIVKKEAKSSHEIMHPFEEMDRMFDALFHRGWLRPFPEIFPDWRLFGEREFELRAPRVDVLDRDKDILVRAELPGVDKKDLEVNLSGSTLTIRGESRKETKESEDDYYRSEIRHGAFSRTIELPEEVREDGVKADFKDGMLEIRLPKAHKTERRRITIE